MKNMPDSVRTFVHEWSLNILILLFGTTTLVQAFIVPMFLSRGHRSGRAKR